jgi:hypothetical protein
MTSTSVTTWPPSAQFWSTRFLTETADATTPILFEDLAPTDVLGVDAVLAGLRRLRRAAVGGEPTSARTRVYVGEQRRDDLIDAVLTSPWADGEGFVGWMQQLCGAGRFSVVINNLETTSPVLSATFGQLIGAAYAGWGVPIGGCEQVAFIGNYAGTAFGVHEGFEDAFLVHLGPGVKHFYCWSPELYRELTGDDAPTFGDYRWLLEHGQRFDLKAGDVLFLPQRVFHVGVQDQFSVSVALPFYTFPDARLLALSILPGLFESAVAGVTTPSAMHRLLDGPAPVAESLTQAANAMLADAVEPLALHVREQVERRWTTLLSNGGWEPVEHDVDRADSARAAAEALAAGGTHMHVIPPFALHTVLGSDNCLEVTVRATTVTIHESQDWGWALAELAAGHTVEITAALRGPSLTDLLASGGIGILATGDESR